MTLVEVLVALAILGLMASLVFSNIGGWLAQSRTSMNNAAFWRSTASAQIALTEVVSASIDPETWRLSTTQVSFRTLLPRLSSTPLSITLHIETDDAGSRLRLDAGAIQSTILTAPAPLRFASRSRRGVVLEMWQADQWRPIASADFVANAPLACEFDMISRDCR